MGGAGGSSSKEEQDAGGRHPPQLRQSRFPQSQRGLSHARVVGSVGLRVRRRERSSSREPRAAHGVLDVDELDFSAAVAENDGGGGGGGGGNVSLSDYD